MNSCRMIKRIAAISLFFLILSSGIVHSASQVTEKVIIATWNIEHMMKMFDQELMPERSREKTEYFRDEEDLYEIARTMKLPAMDADLIVIQEGPTQEMLDLFNKQWLKGKYEYIKVFKSNTEGQYLGVMAKPGFKALEFREYTEDKDPKNGKLLFSRGPGFVLFLTPGGSKLWLGTTHAKSKSGNSKSVTEWRMRELNRTRQICGELMQEGKAEYLVIAGDFNDDFGSDSYERALKQDAIDIMLRGTGLEELVCLDTSIWKDNPEAATYHCMIKPPKYRSFLDHFFANPPLAQNLKDVYIIQDPIAEVASDHLPIVAVFQLPTKSKEK